MDATIGEASGKGRAEPVAAGRGDVQALRPNRRYWRAVMGRSALPPPRRRLPRLAAALAGFAGSAGLAALASLRPDLGDLGLPARLLALAAACAPAALCLLSAVTAPGRRPTAGSLAEWEAELDLRERLLAEQVAAGRRGSPEPRPRPGAGERGPGAPPKMRRHARIKPREARTFVATEDGRRLNALIVDVSQSGVAVEGNLPGVWIGSMVNVGRRRAKAVRALPRGMAFEFSMPIPPEALTVDLVL